MLSDTATEVDPAEVDKIVRRSALYLALAAKVEGLSLVEFKTAARAPLDVPYIRTTDPGYELGYFVPEYQAEADAEAAYVDLLAQWVGATRRGDSEAADTAASGAYLARRVLWAHRDRLNELVFPWSDPEQGSDEGDPAYLF